MTNSELRASLIIIHQNHPLFSFFFFFFLFFFFVSLSAYGPGGSHEVHLSIKGKGLAANDQQLNFTYVISATSIIPSSGSTAGGREITIYGSGFGNEKSSAVVSLDGSPCDIISINMSHITCTTSAHAAGSVSVDVSIDDSSTSVPNGFLYDSSLDIQVTGVSPLQGSVSGGDVVTISGSSFLETTMVKVGNGDCNIQSWSSGQVTCVTPRHAPGKFPIKVVTPGKGFAVIPDEYKEFEFTFVVHSIFPPNGSVAGGTHVLFTGRGFSCDESRTDITVHGKPCKIRSCNATHVTCETKDVFTTIVVDNSGSHPGQFNAELNLHIYACTLSFAVLFVMSYEKNALLMPKRVVLAVSSGQLNTCIAHKKKDATRGRLKGKTRKKKVM